MRTKNTFCGTLTITPQFPPKSLFKKNNKAQDTLASSEGRYLPGSCSDVIDDGILKPWYPVNKNEVLIHTIMLFSLFYTTTALQGLKQPVNMDLVMMGHLWIDVLQV